MKVVLFSGGRGSQALSKQLVVNPRVALTLAVNGYDDGLSTGEVRRFLIDALGPSDFRKNASRMATALQTCSPHLIELLDLRLPDGTGPAEAEACFAALDDGAAPTDALARRIGELATALHPATRETLRQRLASFRRELTESGRPFSFSDCSLGNLVFAGCFLHCDRRFNPAIDDYDALLGIPEGLIENVTDGTDAHLVALDRDGRLLASEADIVDATRRNHIHDIFLIDQRLDEAEAKRLEQAGTDASEAFLREHTVELRPNPRLLERIAEADLVIYAPGTQHSSLFPSYLTPGLGAAIARNLTAVKLLVTNLQEDAEIPDLSAVSLLEKAVYYLKDKNRLQIPTPCLITHSLINDPTQSDSSESYVPLGRLQTIEDPRLVRIADFEEGTSGRHNAEMILTPFVESLAARDSRPSVAVLLLDSDSPAKLAQSVLEALRAGLESAPVSVRFFYASPQPLDPDFAASLPFPADDVWTPGEAAEESLLRAVRARPFDYAVLFESSGMYGGDEIVNLVSLLQAGRLDAVWGSRRLSIRDIHESYKLRYRKTPILGALSYAGSHALSLAYLALYGRYISDSLSGVRALRARYLDAEAVDLGHKRLNQHLLSMLLRDRGEIFETPVRFFSMSPDKVKRTTVWDGIQSIATILWWRLRTLQERRGGAGELGRGRLGRGSTSPEAGSASR